MTFDQSELEKNGSAPQGECGVVNYRPVDREGVRDQVSDREVGGFAALGEASEQSRLALTHVEDTVVFSYLSRVSLNFH